MIQKLLCWIWGHKIVVKAYTGDQIPTENAFGMEIQSSGYVWKRMPYCLRCGKDSLDSSTERSEI